VRHQHCREGRHACAALVHHKAGLAERLAERGTGRAGPPDQNNIVNHGQGLRQIRRGQKDRNFCRVIDATRADRVDMRYAGTDVSAQAVVCRAARAAAH
jgi:hypothetical protein